ncbi:MAG: undecaprenyldiphospho-muramoylpentapeptide beta-N-acetylglucosaminyltransferase [Candidatus Eisenbacteria bacterium]|nr:undecaprenyldiphospho-muramoylpentapeptide beta-N-acetylglucosaminyltransferase [Candidatus Eisenbacteria bacterium]
MKVLFAGGGTGGHLFPALAVADSLRRAHPAAEILFVGSITGIEASLVPQEGYEFRGFPVVGLPRRVGPRQIRALVAAARCVLKTRRLIGEWKPDVVFATGGFASASVLVASWIARVPVILHEQNSIPGLTNRIASRFAREVHITFSSSRRFFPRRDHLRLSGIPLREGVAAGSRSRALRLFRLDEARKTVFVFGGSQGAHHLNEAILDAMALFAGRKDIQFLLQSGQKDYDWMIERCRRIPIRTWVRPFFPNMGDAYALADLVVCRSGALTLGELAASGRPSILIPFPHATANHQMHNTEPFVAAGASILVPDAELTGEVLAAKIDELIKNPRGLRDMSIHAMRLARPQATDRLVRAIRRVAEGTDGPQQAPLPAPEAPRRMPRRSARGEHVARQGS